MRISPKRSRVATAFAMAVASLVIGTPTAEAACLEAWVDAGAEITRGYFWDVSALGPSEAWAAGVRYDADGNERLFVASWDGVSWTKEPLGFSPLYANMFAIEAVSADDVWASGVYFDEVDNRTELVMFHFDGTEWSVVEAPIARSQRITDMVAFATDDVWAAGWYFEDRHYRPWLLHWNGTSWEVVDVPNPLGSENVFGIDGSSADDLWVVGSSSATGEDGAFILHRDASGWTRVTPPSLPDDPYLADVVSVNESRAFAVGHVLNGQAKLALRWNGTEWRKMPVPDGAGSFGSVDASSARDVVVTGGTPDEAGLSLRWNGRSWRPVSLPDETKGSIFEVEHAAGAWFLAGGRGARTSVLQRCVPGA